LEWLETARRAASLKAIRYVQHGHVVGLGSGSTVALAVEELSNRIREESMMITVIPTSYQSELLAIEKGLRFAELNRNTKVDVAIDGADQVQIGTLDIVKGGGAALAREKIVDSAAEKLVIVVDERKLTDKLGRNQPVPLEILPFWFNATMEKIRRLGGKPAFREGAGKLGPVVSDNGNLIVDVDFGEIQDPELLNKGLKLIPGVVETGLFIGLGGYICVGKRDGTVEVLERNK